MGNNGRIIGQMHVSKAGSDAANGSNWDLAKGSAGGGMTAYVSGNGNSLVIGTGTYEEAIDFRKAGSLKADSEVHFIGNGANSFKLNSPSSATSLIVDAGKWVVKNYLKVFIGDLTFANNQHVSISNMVIESPVESRQNGGFSDQTITYLNCVFKGAYEVYSGGVMQVILDRCLIFNNITLFSASNPAIIRSCYVSLNSIITIDQQTAANIMKASFRKNCVQGLINIGGYNYAIQGHLTGDPVIDHGYPAGTKWLNEANLTAAPHSMSAPNAAGWDTAASSCINRDPLFNDVTLDSFGVQYNSPLLAAGVGGVNVGGVRPSFFILNEDDTIISQSNVNIGLDGQVTVAPGETIGEIVFAPKMAAGGLVATCERLNYLGGLLFNSSNDGGTAKNKNVPDSLNYSAADDGRNPNRLTIQIRWTNTPGTSTPTAYNNSGWATADSWVDMEINSPPKVDDAGKGTGDKAYNPITGQLIAFSWFQRKIIVRNDYSHA